MNTTTNTDLASILALMMGEWERYANCLIAIGFTKAEAEEATAEAMTVWFNS